MPEISLRAYMREIDELIEAEKLDEAMAHCRHVLYTYPKHLETYRLLGKSYLEAKRYGDAADIFQRVLSAVPDDFVAHIGMAIVREDEGNLDAAIWHMERAFETNPANPAIQQELRRLIGRRDGLEPHKVRLTRGALARMYAHGELYQQAITELRSALQEDPERPDLQVLLAEMYWRTNQRDESAAVSNRILEKLPYCLEANRIVAASLQSKERVEEAAVFHRRLAGLDPYSAFVESAMADSSMVEPSAITLERLEWQPGEPLPAAEAGQPGWAATLGMELQEREAREAEEAIEIPRTGPLPSWLDPGEPPPFVPGEEHAEPEPALAEGVGPEPTDLGSDVGFPGDRGPEAQEEPMLAAEPSREPDRGEGIEPPPEPEMEVAGAPPIEPASEAQIPEWMRDAGWAESAGEVVERPVSFSDEELSTLEAGELPSETPAAETEGELAPAQLPEWIHDIAPAEEMELREPVEAESGIEPSEVPGWLEEVAAAEAEEAAPAPAQPVGEGIGEQEAPIDEPPAEPIGAEIDAQEVPTWISDGTPGATDTIVTWLTDREREGLKQAPAAPDQEEVPEWMSDTGPLDDEQPIESVAAEPEGVEALSRLEETLAEEEPIVMESSEPDRETIPSWLEEARGEVEIAEAGEAAITDEPAPVIEPLEQPAPEEPPGWLAAVAEAAAKEEPPSREPGFEPQEPVAEPEAEAPPEAETPAVSEAPEWLQGLAETIKEAEPAPEPDWLPPEPAAEIPAERSSAAADTPDWLRGLAQEGAPEEPAASATEAPDWLKKIVEPSAQPEPESPEQPEVPERVEGPGWLAGLTEEAPTPVDEMVETGAREPGLEEQPAVLEPPDWVKAAQAEEVAAETGEAEPVAASEETEAPLPPAPEEAEGDEVLTWLEDLAAKQAEEEGEPAEEGWGRIAVGELPEEPLVEDRHLPEEPEEGLEWLEQLADQRGLDLDVSTPPEPAKAAAEAAPEVPVEAPSAEPVAPEPPEAEPAEPEEVPEWLQRMATAPTIPIPRETIDEAVGTPIAEEPEAIEAAEMAVGAEPPEEEVPEWLASMAEEPPPSEPAARPEVEAAPLPADETMPSAREAVEAPAEPPPVVEPAAEVAPVAEPEAPTVVEPAAGETAAPVVAEAGLPEPEPEVPKAPPSAKPKAFHAGSTLELSRRALAEGDSARASALYGELIKRKLELDSVIEDLRIALDRSPEDPALWQSLGDAYMKADMTSEAIDAYRKGMEAT